MIKRMREHALHWRLVGLVSVAWLAATASLLTGQQSPVAESGKASDSAQTTKPDYRFEVASIRPADPSGRIAGPRAPSSPGRFKEENTTLVSLAMRAFGLKQIFQIEFQPWMITERFSVEATFPAGATSDDLPIMIQHLLEERFGLVFHREARKMPGFEMVAAKPGPKLAKSAEPRPAADPGPTFEMKNGVPQFTKNAGSGQLMVAVPTPTAMWRGRNETMKTLADKLASQLGAPVLDRTGLEGEFDYDLTFTPEPKSLPAYMVVTGPATAIPSQETPKDDFLTNPLLRNALQIQLGLKLQPIKDVPAEVIVLDSARKEPTAN